MSQSLLHGNAFAGISGSVTGIAPGLENDARLLVDPSGRWAIRLTALGRPAAQALLQILRDLAPPATQAEGNLIRQVAAFDVAARHDATLMTDITDGLAALDTLARKLTKRGYMDITERTLRRTLLGQISNLSLMDRLGVRTPAAATAG